MIKKDIVFTLICLVAGASFLAAHIYVLGIFLIFLAVLIILLCYKQLIVSLKDITFHISNLRNQKSENRYVLRKDDAFINVKKQLNEFSDEIFPILQNRKSVVTRIKNIIDLMESPVILLSYEGRIILYNKAAEIFMRTGCSGCFYYEVLKNIVLLDAIKHCLDTDLHNNEIKIGENIYQMSSFRDVYDTGKKLIFCVFNDVTLFRKKDKLEREFISAVSHELKTPLSVIIGMSEIINDEEVADKERKKYIKSIMKNAERMNKLVEKLLILTEIRASNKINRSKVNLKKCVETVLENERLYAENKGIAIKTDLKDAWVSGDAFLLVEMIRNIVSNAIRYTDIGSIKITVNNDLFATVNIKDTGRGIDKELLPHIFEPFYRSGYSRNRTSGGSGLGLTIAKRIANLHKGNITVKSSVGTGSEFTIQIPLLYPETNPKQTRNKFENKDSQG